MVASDSSEDQASSSRKRHRQHDRDHDRRRSSHRDNHDSRRHRHSSREERRRDERSSGRNQEKRSRNDFGSRNHHDERPRQSGKKSSFLEDTSQKGPEPGWGRQSETVKSESGEKDVKPVEKEKPNFGLSGKLTEDSNTLNGVVIKYSEPEDARKPVRRWRLYVFKGETHLPMLPIHR